VLVAHLTPGHTKGQWRVDTLQSRDQAAVSGCVRGAVGR